MRTPREEQRHRNNQPCSCHLLSGHSFTLLQVAKIGAAKSVCLMTRVCDGKCDQDALVTNPHTTKSHTPQFIAQNWITTPTSTDTQSHVIKSRKIDRVACTTKSNKIPEFGTSFSRSKILQVCRSGTKVCNPTMKSMDKVGITTTCREDTAMRDDCSRSKKCSGR